MAWLSIALVVFGNVIYHLGQRKIPQAAHPVAATFAAYLVALVVTAATFPLVARGLDLRAAWRPLNGSTVLVGAGIVAIELGFLLAYRAGWVLSNASLTANVIVAVLFLAIGAVFLREHLSWSRMAGVGLCLAGLWLVARPT
jgi:drug/metabolite transporter (DMT)-like permease